MLLGLVKLLRLMLLVVKRVGIVVYHKARAGVVYMNELISLLHRRGEWKDAKLSPEEKRAANAFYKEHYGRKVPLYWHRLYRNYTGIFDERYLPEYIYSMKLEEVLNPHLSARPLGNKAFNPQFLFDSLPQEEHIRVPRFHVMNCAGNLWDDQGRLISAGEAAARCADLGEVILKPTVETMGARGVRLLELRGGVDQRTGTPLADILREYRRDFVLQERVRNHPSIAALYPESVNTLRVITYLCDQQVCIAPLSMRLGIDGRVVDNAGIFIGVSPEGVLSDVGFSKKGIRRFTEHPTTGVSFAGYRIEGVPQILAAARRLHARLPQLGMISWDLAYDPEGNVVVIEANTTGQSVWFPQMVTGQAFFGENTARMLALLKKR